MFMSKQRKSNTNFWIYFSSINLFKKIKALFRVLALVFLILWGWRTVLFIGNSESILCLIENIQDLGMGFV